MKVSNRFTLSRALFAPFFFLIYNLPLWLHSNTFSFASDGHYARKYNEVSDFGKIFDPFADVILNLTVFACAVSSGYMPMVLFILILYREFSQTFLRMAALKKGVAIAARKGGKLKTVFYIISGFFFLVIESYKRLALSFIPENVCDILLCTLKVFFVICVLLSWGSFIDYLKSFYKVARD